MSQIYSVRNGGNGKIQLGMKKVNSYQVYPITVTALASPFLTIANDVWLNYDWINANQTSASTDALFLPTTVGSTAANQFYPAGSVGSEYRIFAVTAMKVLPPADTISSINGGTNSQGISLAAGTYGIFTATTKSGVGLLWVCQAISAAGVVSSPVAA